MTDPETPPAPSVPGILEAAIYAEDLDAAEMFYGTILWLEVIQKVPGRHVFFRAGPSVVLVFNPSATEQPSRNPNQPVPPHGARGAGHICLMATAEDLDRWTSRLTRDGVEIEADFRWPNGARSIYVRDPAGNSVELAEPHLWD